MLVNDRCRGTGVFWVTVLLLAISGCERTPIAPEEAQSDVRAVVVDALNAWQQAEWQKMYQTLSSADKEAESFPVFQQKRERLNKAQQLTGFRIDEIVRSGGGAYEVHVTLEMEENYNSGFRSELEPRTTETAATWYVVRENDSYRITFGEC